MSLSRKATVLKKAEFNPRLKTYLYVYVMLTMAVTIIGIPLLPIWLLAGPFWIGKYFNELECELTTRSLSFKKGLLVKVEKTIPLDKIQDLTFKEGPILKAFGLSILKVETAGNSSDATSDLSLIGIVDAHEFRQLVFDQRDIVTDNVSSGGSSSDSMIEVLSEIRDSLIRIENKIGDNE